MNCPGKKICQKPSNDVPGCTLLSAISSLPFKALRSTWTYFLTFPKCSPITLSKNILKMSLYSSQLVKALLLLFPLPTPCCGQISQGLLWFSPTENQLPFPWTFCSFQIMPYLFLPCVTDSHEIALVLCQISQFKGIVLLTNTGYT